MKIIRKSVAVSEPVERFLKKIANDLDDDKNISFEMHIVEPGDEGYASIVANTFIPRSADSAQIEKQVRAEIAKTNGQKGGKIRHAPTNEVRDWALEKVREMEVARGVKWKSANQAAHAVKGSVLEHARTTGANLSEENIQRTNAKWIGDDKKSVKQLG